MKKLSIILPICIALCASVFGRPSPVGPKPMHHPAPAFYHPLKPMPHVRPIPPPPPHRHSYWGRGGRNFWPAFGVGTLVGAALATTVVEQPTVVVQAPGRVWVPPVYETRPVYDVFGRIIGYEQVMVRPGYWTY